MCFYLSLALRSHHLGLLSTTMYSRLIQTKKKIHTIRPVWPTSNRNGIQSTAPSTIMRAVEQLTSSSSR